MRRGGRPWTGVVAAALLGCLSTSGARPTIHHLDVDGDGRTDRFETVDDRGRVRAVVMAPTPNSNPARTVVIAIDAVPYDVFAAAQRQGRFGAFFPASRMVAPFPSLTNVSFVELLRTERALGYEDRFFDPDENRIAGGILDRLSEQYKTFAGFHALFDWEEPHLWGGAAYIVPERVAWAELHRFEEQLYDADGEHRLLYLGSPDALGHVGGRPALAEHLERVAEVLDRFLAAGGGTHRVVLFSDHGMSHGAGHRFDLEGALEAAGFALTDEIRTSRDVVAPAYGLVGSVQLFSACGSESRLARALAVAPGVDFSVWSDAGAIGFSDREGGTAADRPADRYPALEDRLRNAVGNHTRYPASVLLSLEEGWYYGSPLFDRIVDLRGTHGSAHYDSSVGFLASNVARTPRWIRAGEVYEFLGIERPPAVLQPRRARCVTVDQTIKRDRS